MDKFCKCRFCKSYDSFDGCEWGCNNFEGYEPNKERLIEFAKEEGIRVTDVIALINL
jgi:hypothetical protein